MDMAFLEEGREEGESLWVRNRIGDDREEEKKTPFTAPFHEAALL